MSDKKRGLGRGLGALIPTVSEYSEGGPRPTEPRPMDVLIPERSVPAPIDDDPAGGYFAELPVEKVVPNSRQPRQVFDDDELDELVLSIQEVGLLQPIVVRPQNDDTFELVMGERRLRATQKAGLPSIPAIVRNTEDENMLRDALLENLHRSPLNPLEEAAAYDQLLKDFSCSYEELAGRIGRSRPQISNTLRLLKLSPAVQKKVAAGTLTAGHARALLGIHQHEIQEDFANRIVAEGLSVRAIEELVAITVEENAPKEKSPRASRPVSPRLTEFAAKLSTRFDTRVKVDLGRYKGKVAIEFATLEDLERILTIIDPSLIDSNGSPGNDDSHGNEANFVHLRTTTLRK